MSQTSSQRRAAGLLVTCIALAEARPITAAESGTLCIAPFHRDEPKVGQPPNPGEPLMSTTPAPSWRSTFSFRFDRSLETHVKNHEMKRVEGLRLDRRIQVEVRLDGKPFETFYLDFGGAPDHRICLWLYPGYWHWIDNGWNLKLGCKCQP